ncbi:hypothetical protein ACT1U9_00980 [Streptomyces sp. BR1]|uniref:hypothetical protein n=1 Tax=Streptomyces sp. BR1 TaxID=1592323 RepID=UPI00402B299C
MTRRPLRQRLCGAIALGLFCAGGAATASTAHAASATATWAMDDGAQGLASSPVAGSLFSVPRADGRVDQFQLFYDSTATGGLPFVRHRDQSEPNGGYGAWVRVCAPTVCRRPRAATRMATPGRVVRPRQAPPRR